MIDNVTSFFPRFLRPPFPFIYLFIYLFIHIIELRDYLFIRMVECLLDSSIDQIIKLCIRRIIHSFCSNGEAVRRCSESLTFFIRNVDIYNDFLP